MEGEAAVRRLLRFLSRLWYWKEIRKPPEDPRIISESTNHQQKTITFATKSDIGRRPNNEDAVYALESEGKYLFAVADGMGGYSGGEVASKIAVEALKDFFLEDDEKIPVKLKEVIQLANKQIFERSHSSLEFSGMGTTLSIAVISGEKLHIAHVGDSRIYRVRDNEIMQLTQDHSLVAEALRMGTITPEEAKRHPMRNVITRAIGTELELEVDAAEEQIAHDDIIVLCTDGLSNYVEDGEIKKLVKQYEPEQACEKLVKLAKDRNGADNISAIVVKV